MAHAVRQIEDSLFTVPSGYDGRSIAYRRADLIGRAEGSVHMGFYISELQPGGTMDAAIHSFEKGIFVTEGEVELNRDGKVFRLGPNDFALVPIGIAHAFRNRAAQRVRWIEKCGPRPKLPDEWQDSFFTKPLAWPADGAIESVKTPLVRMIGHFDKSQLPPHLTGDEHISGQSKKMLMDKIFGAQHFDMFIIEFAKDGKTTRHDHNFEEAYVVLDGEVTYEAEGKTYVLKPGTIAWSGVGAPHGFAMDRGTSCSWLEVMSPQPPVQQVGRRFSVWEKNRRALAI
jgi:quercetin dioxygenase-like cupin family protein